ncbi:hypothetical protein G6F31_016238 [Rhizopus arrhizus]|nr:hypothetical protein G6F31_016238 [Rhizopus arrhizus]
MRCVRWARRRADDAAPAARAHGRRPGAVAGAVPRRVRAAQRTPGARRQGCSRAAPGPDQPRRGSDRRGGRRPAVVGTAPGRQRRRRAHGRAGNPAGLTALVGTNLGWHCCCDGWQPWLALLVCWVATLVGTAGVVGANLGWHWPTGAKHPPPARPSFQYRPELHPDDERAWPSGSVRQ